MKAIKHAESFFKLCGSVKGSVIAFSLHKDSAAILESLKEDFPELFANDGAKLRKLDEEVDVKNVKSRERWRNWIKKWEKVEDYNFGTLLRSDTKDEYSEQNSMFGGHLIHSVSFALCLAHLHLFAVTRIQFLAVEIARCSMGMNDWIYEQVCLHPSNKCITQKTLTV